MNLPRFLAEVSVRARVTDRTVADPIGAIVSRLCAYPRSIESKALAKACLAVIECEGEITESELGALGRDALLLLDRFSTERFRLRYKRRELDSIAATLKELVTLA